MEGQAVIAGPFSKVAVRIRRALKNRQVRAGLALETAAP